MAVPFETPSEDLHMKNHIKPGNRITVIAPAGGLVGGDFYIAGAAFGIVSVTVAEGEEVEIHVGEAWTLPKATGAAWAIGDKIYWDATAKNMTKTATANTLVGVAFRVAVTADTSGAVLLNKSF